MASFAVGKIEVVREFAAQAGLVLRNVRLIEELRESRRRIVSAQDERAKALERNIHDGAQQQLVALAVKQRLAERLTLVVPTWFEPVSPPESVSRTVSCPAAEEDKARGPAD